MSSSSPNFRSWSVCVSLDIEGDAFTSMSHSLRSCPDDAAFAHLKQCLSFMITLDTLQRVDDDALDPGEARVDRLGAVFRSHEALQLPDGPLRGVSASYASFFLIACSRHDVATSAVTSSWLRNCANPSR